MSACTMTPCLPALVRPTAEPRHWTPPPATANFRLSSRDTVAVIQLPTGRYAVAVTLAPAPRPTGQTDDLDERLVHAARFRSRAAALRLRDRVVAAGWLDVSCWLWEPRAHGRFVAPPTATPYVVER